MPGIYVPSHIAGKNAYQFVGDERGVIASSPSLATVTQSFTWTIQIWPSRVGEYGLLVRGDQGNPDWGFYAKSRASGQLEVGIQDQSNGKLIFVSTNPILAVDRPTEFAVRWNYVDKTFSMFKNAAPQAFSLDGSSTTTTGSFGLLMIPSADPNWYLSYVNNTTSRFEGIYYGMSFLDDVITDQAIFDNYSPRAYTGTPPSKPYIYFLSDQGSNTGAGYHGVWRMKEDGTAREMLSSSGISGQYALGVSVDRLNTRLLMTYGGSTNLVKVTDLAGASINPLLTDQAQAAPATWIGDNHAYLDLTIVSAQPGWAIDVTSSLVGSTAGYSGKDIAQGLTGGGEYYGSGTYRVIQMNTLPLAGNFAYVGIWTSYSNTTLGRFNSIRGTDINNPLTIGSSTTAPQVIDSVAGVTVPLAMSSLAISPDGTKLAYTKKVGSYTQVFVSGLSGEGLQQLTTASNNHYVSGWNPTSDKILFSRYIGTKWQLFTMTATGADQTNISNNSFSEYVVGGMCWQ